MFEIVKQLMELWWRWGEGRMEVQVCWGGADLYTLVSSQ